MTAEEALAAAREAEKAVPNAILPSNPTPPAPPPAVSAPVAPPAPPFAPTPPAPVAVLPTGARGALSNAPPPRRALSAAEALAAARESELSIPAAPRVDPPTAAPASVAVPPAAVAPPAPSAAPPLGDGADDAFPAVEAAQALLRVFLPDVPAWVAAAVRITERGEHRALWKEHRARLAGAGDLGAALACGAVVQALMNRPPGALVYTLVVVSRGELLVVLDLDARTIVGVFRDAKSWRVSFD